MYADATLFTLLIILTVAAGTGCGDGVREDVTEQTEEPLEASTFADDVDFLREHGDVQLLSGSNGAQVALSAQHQGRVMTSAVASGERSLGWINRDFIESGRSGTAFDNVGGEDRFWLGPEGGQFGLYFPPGSAFEFDAWQVPPAFNTGTWNLVSHSDTSATFSRSMQLTNYSEVRFDVDVERTVRLLSDREAASVVGEPVPDGVRWVGFETINRITNAGESAWGRGSGMPSIWILGQYEPFGTTYVVIPFDTTMQARGNSTVVNDAYFGDVPDDRLDVRDGYVLFKCDGEYRSKIGLGPDRALDVLGAYNAQHRILTVVRYNRQKGATEFVNSMWEIQDRPFRGDVVNAYNDGPPEPGVPALGGFYELETSSPALDLGPGESYTHVHHTIHLVGSSANELSPLAERLLGVSLDVVSRDIE